MVMDTGEGCNPTRLPAWFLQEKDSYTPQLPEAEKGLIHQDSSGLKRNYILWALDDRGIFTLFEDSQGFEPMGSIRQLVGRAAFDVFKNNPDAVDAVSRGLEGKQVNTTFDYDGSRWEMCGYPLRNEAGGVSGLVGVAKNLIDKMTPKAEQQFEPKNLPEVVTGNTIPQIQQHDKNQLRLNRLGALHEIDRAITDNTDLTPTLNIVLNHVLMQLGIDAAVILLLNPDTQRLEFAAGSGFHSNAMKSTSVPLEDCRGRRVRLNNGSTGCSQLFRCERTCLRLSLQRREGFLSHFGAPWIVRGQVYGVLELFHRRPLNPAGEWFSFLETIATQAAIAVDNVALYTSLQHSNTALSQAYEATLEGWVRALDLRDKETEGHTQRVTEMTLQLARAIGVSQADLIHIRRGALLHDIGKMGISDNILNKPGPLSSDEWDIMKQHPVHANNLLAPIGFLKSSIDIPYNHHEKWNGMGYPRGLSGKGIPLSARIFAVIDVWDALRSDRPYRGGWSKEKARNYIRTQSGEHFDPWIAYKFLEMGMDR